MIEINLVPDVKRELLRAQRMRNLVIFIATVTGIASVAITVILVGIVYVGQSIASSSLDGAIANEHSTLTNQENINYYLTTQDQLLKTSQLTTNKKLPSRIFALLDVILPEGDNKTTISELNYDQATNVIRFDGQSNNGYIALEALQKIIERTIYAYPSDSYVKEYEELTSVADKANFCRDSQDSTKYDETKCNIGNLTSQAVRIGDTSYGQSSSGGLVLRFTIDITLDRSILDFNAQYVSIIGPTKQNVTDSYIQIPEGMFDERADDLTPEQEAELGEEQNGE